MRLAGNFSGFPHLRRDLTAEDLGQKARACAGAEHALKEYFDGLKRQSYRLTKQVRQRAAPRKSAIDHTGYMFQKSRAETLRRRESAGKRCLRSIFDAKIHAFLILPNQSRIPEQSPFPFSASPRLCAPLLLPPRASCSLVATVGGGRPLASTID